MAHWCGSTGLTVTLVTVHGLTETTVKTTISERFKNVNTKKYST